MASEQKEIEVLEQELVQGKESTEKAKTDKEHGSYEAAEEEITKKVGKEDKTDPEPSEVADGIQDGVENEGNSDESMAADLEGKGEERGEPKAKEVLPEAVAVDNQVETKNEGESKEENVVPGTRKIAKHAKNPTEQENGDDKNGLAPAEGAAERGGGPDEAEMEPFEVINCVEILVEEEDGNSESMPAIEEGKTDEERGAKEEELEELGMAPETPKMTKETEPLIEEEDCDDENVPISKATGGGGRPDEAELQVINSIENLVKTEDDKEGKPAEKKLELVATSEDAGNQIDDDNGNTNSVPANKEDGTEKGEPKEAGAALWMLKTVSRTLEMANEERPPTDEEEGEDEDVPVTKEESKPLKVVDGVENLFEDEDANYKSTPFTKKGRAEEEGEPEEQVAEIEQLATMEDADNQTEVDNDNQKSVPASDGGGNGNKGDAQEEGPQKENEERICQKEDNQKGSRGLQHKKRLVSHKGLQQSSLFQVMPDPAVAPAPREMIKAFKAELIQKKNNVEILENNLVQKVSNQSTSQNFECEKNYVLCQDPPRDLHWPYGSFNAAPVPVPVQKTVNGKQKDIDALEACIAVLELELAQEKEKVKNNPRKTKDLQYQKNLVLQQDPPCCPLQRNHVRSAALAPVEHEVDHGVTSKALVNHNLRLEEQLKSEQRTSLLARIEVKHMRAAIAEKTIIEDTASIESLDSFSDMTINDEDMSAMRYVQRLSTRREAKLSVRHL